MEESLKVRISDDSPGTSQTTSQLEHSDKTSTWDQTNDLSSGSRQGQSDFTNPLGSPTVRSSDTSNETISENLATSNEPESLSLNSQSEEIETNVNCLKGGVEEGVKSEEDYKLPQLRKMTPRLAKIRSAENMKLMAQVLGPKGPSSNCGNIKAKAKQELSKIDDDCSASAKGDNEDEIAELMLASTTIKRDTISRKKAKQVRELENIKRLVEAENDNSNEERATKYAVSFFQKLQSMLIHCDTDTFRSVVNLFLNYCEKINALDQAEVEEEIKDRTSESSTCDASLLTMSSVASDRCRDKLSDEKDILAAQLYTEVCAKLQEYPELCSDFLLFLTPRQAAMVDQSVEYMMLHKMKEFINVAQVYFAKQPSRMAKIMQALTSLASDPHCTIESVKEVMSPILKSHPVVMDLFLQVLPDGKPPNSLFAPNMFENLICPVGPHDKNKIYTENSPELYENIKLPVPTSQDEPYGGESCKCDCHNDEPDSRSKTMSEHCASCGTRFLNGRIYLQTPEGLRPAKITFPGADEEQLENIARVSLKITEKMVIVPPVKRRKRNSKSESNESNIKSGLSSNTKSSPTKENDETVEKLATKTKKLAKSPPKSSDQQKKTVKSELMPSSSSGNKKSSNLTKHMREKRREQKSSPIQIKPELCAEDYELQSDSSPLMSYDINEGYSDEMMTIEKMEIFIESEEHEQSESDNSLVNETKPWTREEDALLLKTVKEEGLSPSTFGIISESLRSRSIQDVKERCDTLFSLLKKMN